MKRFIGPVLLALIVCVTLASRAFCANLKAPRYQSISRPHPRSAVPAKARFQGSSNSLGSSQGKPFVAGGQNTLDKLGSVSLNPQPLPPRTAVSGIFDKVNAASLNPQPLPPRTAASTIFDKLNAASLNPQPLPPGGGPLSTIFQRQ